MMKDLAKLIGAELPTAPLPGVPDSVIFCRGDKQCLVRLMIRETKGLRVLVREGCCDVIWPDGVRPILVENPEWDFWRYHNWYWGRHYNGRPLVVTEGVCAVHPTAVIGVNGLRIAQGPLLERMPVHHVGDVVLRHGCSVEAHAVIHRAVMGSTVIEEGAIIGALCNVGHNARIGAGTLLAPGALIGGSADVGKDCFIGMGSVIGNGVRVCDGVRLGANSVVMRSIGKPGIWFGSPALYKRQWDGRW